MLTVGMRTWCLIGILFVCFGYLGAGGLGRQILSEDADVRTGIARRWAQRVSVDLPELPNRPRVAVARVVSDTDGILTRELRDWIGRQNVRMVYDDWWQEPGYAFGVASEPQSIHAASDRIRRDNVDYIVCARIDEWVTYPAHAARLVGTIEILDASTGKTVYSARLGLPDGGEFVGVDLAKGAGRSTGRSTAAIEPPRPLEVTAEAADAPHTPNRSSASRTAIHTAGQVASPAHNPGEPLSLASMSVASPVRMNVWQGLGVWLMTVLLLPVGLAAPIQRVLHRRSNRDNALMLLAWTGLVLFAAWLFWGWSFSIFPLMLALTVTSGVAIAWFGFVCSRLI